VLDWTHCNGIDYRSEDDSYLLSCKNNDAIYKVDRAGGSLVWELGGEPGDFSLTDGLPFTDQHGPKWTGDDTLLVFGNGDKRAEEPYSLVQEFAVDEAARTYAEIWRYDADQAFYVYILGNAERLDDGSTFTAWGSSGVTREVTLDGGLRREFAAGMGSLTGYSHSVAELGGPR